MYSYLRMNALSFNYTDIDLAALIKICQVADHLKITPAEAAKRIITAQAKKSNKTTKTGRATA